MEFLSITGWVLLPFIFTTKNTARNLLNAEEVFAKKATEEAETTAKKNETEEAIKKIAFEEAERATTIKSKAATVLVL